MMLGLLLARAGVRVLVLEKHADFLRDFRGDTIHPSTLEVMHELGLLDGLLRLPHQKVPQFSAKFGDREVVIADLSRLPVRCRFIAMMPQWDFLNFLAAEARRYPGFELRMNAEVTSLIERDGHVSGLNMTTPDGVVEVNADLVIGADGRNSTVARLAGARRYNVTENERAGGVAYYEGIEPHGVFHLYILGSTYFIGSSSDSGLFMASAYYDKADHRRFRAANGFEDALATCPAFASLLEGATLTAPPQFASRWEGFFRESAGPGWALVGDAGHFKDPAPGQGIADAIRQAERLAEHLRTLAACVTREVWNIQCHGGPKPDHAG